jgi:hypothetical protein
MGDSLPKDTGPISLTDTHPRTEHLQNPTATARENPSNGKPSSAKMLKLLGDATVGDRSSLLSSTWLK